LGQTKLNPFNFGKRHLIFIKVTFVIVRLVEKSADTCSNYVFLWLLESTEVVVIVYLLLQFSFLRERNEDKSFSVIRAAKV